MSDDQAGPYQVKKVAVIAKGADVLVREYVLGLVDQPGKPGVA